MPDNEKKDSYEVLLEKIDAMQKRIDEQDVKLKEMTDFNRALLARDKKGSNVPDVDVSKKFQAYLEDN